ncbi:hypothetical protein ACFZDF_33985 [Streptomyces sp. NPDC007910]|uniref:hypothetical protein n=1 Tax=Streptomyces sp. NPDC007910 TaxID=3364790 RepID=UPI0036DFBE0D
MSVRDEQRDAPHHPDDVPGEDVAGDDLEVRETFRIASEFAPHVTVTEQTFFGHGWQPLTTSILMTLWYLPADASFDIPFLVDWYERLGWKGANGKPLGAPVIRREIKLIREAGYVQVDRLRGEKGRSVGIRYSVSQRRTDQPSDGSWVPVLPSSNGDNGRSDHVRPMTTRGQSPHVANGDNCRSDHVRPMTTRGQSPHVANAAKPQVAPRVANAPSPPHPPEEEELLLPSTPHTPPGSLPSQREEEGREFSTEELAAAAVFLQSMKRWQAGRKTAMRCAPRLLRAMREQSWPELSAMDEAQRDLLEADVLRNTGGADSWERCLPGWCDDLRRYAALSARPAAAAAATGRERDETKCWKPGHGGGTFRIGDCPDCVRESRPRREGSPARLDTAALMARLRRGLPPAADGES